MEGRRPPKRYSVRQPSSGVRSQREVFTMVPPVDTAEELRKHAVRRRGVLEVWVTINVRLGEEVGGWGKGGSAAGSV